MATKYFLRDGTPIPALAKSYTKEEAEKAKAALESMGLPIDVKRPLKGHITRRTEGWESPFDRWHREFKATTAKAEAERMIKHRVTMMALKGEAAALALECHRLGLSVSEIAAHSDTMDEAEVRALIESAMEAEG